MAAARKSSVKAKDAPLRLGFVPLIDAAPLLVADRFGFFAEQGLAVELVRQTSWAGFRDRVSVGELDGGHTLASMPAVLTRGIGGIAHPTSTVAPLNRNGNTIVLADALWRATKAEGAVTPQALAAALRRRRAQGLPSPVFGVVYAYSTHRLLLTLWLEQGGIVVGRDVRLAVVPPPLMADHLGLGRIDGYCVGEPWGQRAVDLGLGGVAAATGDILPNHIEKTLGVATARLRRDPTLATRLIAGLDQAAAWLGDPAHCRDAALWLGDADCLGAPAALIERALTGQLLIDADGAERFVPNFMNYDFDRRPAAWRGELRRLVNAILAAPPLAGVPAHQPALSLSQQGATP